MPELPEVETITRGLQQILGSVIVNADTSMMKGLLKNRNEQELQSSLLSMVVVSVVRHGKWIQFNLKDVSSVGNNQALLSHLGMYGTWLINSSPSFLPPHARLRLTLATHQGPKFLTYVDMRSWGKLYTFTPIEAMQFMRGRVGVDATIVTISQLRYFLRSSLESVVTMLLDQSKIAGIGNIYRSEILWRARIAPDRPCTDLIEEESDLLWRSIRGIMTEAINFRGSSIKDYRDTNGQRGGFDKFLQVYGKTGCVCPRNCSYQSLLDSNKIPVIVSTKRFDDRAVFYCPSCQK